MLKAPLLKNQEEGLLGFSGLVSVSTPGKEVVKKSRYSFAILLNFCQELQCSIVIFTSWVLADCPASSLLGLVFLDGGAADTSVASSAALFLPGTLPRAMAVIISCRSESSNI